MKIALFKDPKYEWSEPVPWLADRGLSDYAMISEVIDVEFPPLSRDAIVRQQLDALDKKEAEVRAEFQRQLDAFKGRRAELQALTYVPAAD